jgi:hypothetical protein
MDIWHVYRKIREICQQNIERRSVSINLLTRELNSEMEVVEEYVNALAVLKFIQPTDTGGLVLLR